MNEQEHENRALYLYCVGNAADLSEVSGDGIDHRFAPYALADDGLVAVVSEVSMADFCGSEADRRLEDLQWMSERAVRHERIVDAALARGPVLPVRFGTLFSGAEVLRRFLEINRDAIRGFLELARGHEEWGIKGFLDRGAAAKWLAASAPAQENTPISPGLSYLRERRAQAAAQSELHRWVADSCAAAVESMREFGDEWRSRKVIDSAAGDGSPQAVLNAAVLLRRGRSKDFLACVDGINAEREAQGLSFMATGPWPLYSFCPQLRTPR